MLSQNNKNIATLMTIISLVFFLTACSSTPKTHFFQLEEIRDQALTQVSQGVVVGIGPLTIPEYIDRPQIVARNKQGGFNLLEFNRWLEPIDSSIRRSLVVNLSNNLHSNFIVALPRDDQQQALDLRLAVEIDQFVGQIDDTVRLEARWSIFAADDKLLLTKVSIISQKIPLSNQNNNGVSINSSQAIDYQPLVKTMNQVLKALGNEISQSMEKLMTQ